MAEHEFGVQAKQQIRQKFRLAKMFGIESYTMKINNLALHVIQL